jgi:hypothetical protein
MLGSTSLICPEASRDETAETVTSRGLGSDDLDDDEEVASELTCEHLALREVRTYMN